MKNTEMIIDIEEIVDIENGSGPSSKSIYHTDCASIMSMIKRLASDALDYKPNQKNELRKFHRTITIDGERGSGKSTLLKYISQELRSDSEQYAVMEFDNLDFPIPERKEHFLANVIAEIVALVKTQWDNKASYIDTVDRANLSVWHETLRNLTEGLPYLIGVCKNVFEDEWVNTDSIIESGLSKVHAVNDFEFNFHCFINASLVFLRKEAFVVLLDDIDQNFPKGSVVIETLRKYFTTPQIVVVLSGDISLFSMLIRKIQWENFGKVLVENEQGSPKTSGHIKELVEDLESQYLMKVLPPEYRYKLKPLLEKSRSNKIGIKINGVLEELISFYEAGLKKNGVTKMAKVYTNYLLSLPIRTQIKVIDCFAKDKCEREYDWKDIFICELKSEQIDIWSAQRHSRDLNKEIVSYLTRNRLLVDGVALLPTSNDCKRNAIYTALWLEATGLMHQNAGMAFDYLARICFLREIMVSLMTLDGESQSKIDALMEYASYRETHRMRYLSCMTLAFFLNFNQKKSLLSDGFVVKNDILSSWMGTGVLKFNSSTLKEELSKAPEQRRDYIRFLGYLSVGLFTDPHNDVIPLSSASILWGSLTDMILSVRSSGRSLPDFKKELKKLTQLQCYPYPATGSNQELSDCIFSTPLMDSKEDELDSLINSIYNWIECLDKNPNIEKGLSPYLMSRISKRLIHSFQTQKLEHPESFAEWLQKISFAILNAVFIEESIERKEDLSVTLIHCTDIKYFYPKDTEKPEVYDNELHFFNWLRECPIFKAYAEEDLSTFLNITIMTSVSVKHLLEQIDAEKAELVAEEEAEKEEETRLKNQLRIEKMWSTYLACQEEFTAGDLKKSQERLEEIKELKRALAARKNSIINS